jgi:hypothetical protein
MFNMAKIDAYAAAASLSVAQSKTAGAVAALGKLKEKFLCCGSSTSI